MNHESAKKNFLYINSSYDPNVYRASGGTGGTNGTGTEVKDFSSSGIYASLSEDRFNFTDLYYRNVRILIFFFFHFFVRGYFVL